MAKKRAKPIGKLAGAIGPLSPPYVLNGLLQQLSDIESVVVVVKYKDETFHTTWSCQDLSTLSLKHFVLGMYLQERPTEGAREKQ